MQYLQTRLFLLFVLTTHWTNAWADIVEYSFDIDYQTVNFTGDPVQAMTVGGSIPAPTIEATVGDTLRVTFNNKMDVSSSIHWHGVLLPNDQDGVPFLNTPPIQAGTSFTFEYPVIHHGTYWYHSHTGLQEQRGVYGSIVFHPVQGERIAADRDLVVVLSDWTNENPVQVLQNLKRSDDYYALKKDSVQSWQKVFQHGEQAVKNRLDSAWKRMDPMDVSDVGYDAFLVNGQREYPVPDVEPGNRVRLRVINAGASSYFNLGYAGGPMSLVSSDGVDVEPLEVEQQRISVAETFDLIVTVPEDGAYEFRATAEDGTGYGSLLLGNGNVVRAPDIAPPNPFLVDHSMHGGVSDRADSGMPGMDHSGMDHSGMDHSGHNMSPTVNMREYELLRAVSRTEYDASKPQRKVHLELTGDMERYAWSFNNKVLSEDSKILIRQGEVVQFVMENKTMMHHPIHLHGHFFRVLNGQDDFAPLKHTVNVPPMETVTIEFLANEEKDWIFHCHNLYHMKSGMTRVVSYKGTSQSTPTSLAPLFSDLHWFNFTDVGLHSNFAEGEYRAENTRNAVTLEFDWDYDAEYEVELLYERYVNRHLEVYVGAEKEKEHESTESTVVAGFHYLLPLLIEADVRIDNAGQGRLSLGSDLQLTDRVSFNWMLNTDDEHRVALEYEVNKSVSLIANHDDQFDWGLGVELKF